MIQDLELHRRILLELEQRDTELRPTELASSQHSSEVVAEHFRLINEQGLADGDVLLSAQSPLPVGRRRFATPADRTRAPPHGSRMMRRLSRWMAVAFFSFAASCSPAVRSTQFAPAPARAADHPIRVYQQTRPQCPFEELGSVSSRKRNKFVSMDAVMEAMRDRARKMGGDALVGLTEADEARGAVAIGAGIALDRDPVLSATVIRFTDPDCAE